MGERGKEAKLEGVRCKVGTEFCSEKVLLPRSTEESIPKLGTENAKKLVL
jgi:hypothetical protein